MAQGAAAQGQGQVPEAPLPSLSELERLNEACNALPEPQEWQHCLCVAGNGR